MKIQEIKNLITDFKYSENLTFHIPNKVRLIGDYTFESHGSSIYWPFNGHCIIVNKDLTKVEFIPLEIKMTRFILLSSPKLKSKSVIDFNSERLQECDKALFTIQKKKNVEALTALSLKDYRELEHFIPNPILRKLFPNFFLEMKLVSE